MQRAAWRWAGLKAEIEHLIREGFTGEELGVIEWFSAWRRYIFAPYACTVYEETRLRDIADFCQKATQEHRAALRSALKLRA